MLSREWLYHIEKWLKDKGRYVYRECGGVELRYSPADRWMSCEEACSQSFVSIAPGNAMGRVVALRLV